jgi:hypothetical protein
MPRRYRVGDRDRDRVRVRSRICICLGRDRPDGTGPLGSHDSEKHHHHTHDKNLKAREWPAPAPSSPPLPLPLPSLPFSYLDFTPPGPISLNHHQRDRATSPSSSAAGPIPRSRATTPPAQPILDPYELGRSPPRFASTGVREDTDAQTGYPAHRSQVPPVLHEAPRASSASPASSTSSACSTQPHRSTESAGTGLAPPTRGTRAIRAWRPTWDELFPWSPPAADRLLYRAQTPDVESNRAAPSAGDRTRTTSGPLRIDTPQSDKSRGRGHVPVPRAGGQRWTGPTPNHQTLVPRTLEVRVVRPVRPVRLPPSRSLDQGPLVPVRPTPVRLNPPQLRQYPRPPFGLTHRTSRRSSTSRSRSGADEIPSRTPRPPPLSLLEDRPERAC